MVNVFLTILKRMAKQILYFKITVAIILLTVSVKAQTKTITDTTKGNTLEEIVARCCLFELLIRF